MPKKKASKKKINFAQEYCAWVTVLAIAKILLTLLRHLIRLTARIILLATLPMVLGLKKLAR